MSNIECDIEDSIKNQGDCSISSIRSSSTVQNININQFLNS